MRLCLLGLCILVSPLAAHAVTLPYHETFDGDDTTAVLGDWRVVNQTGDTEFTFHDIHDNALRIVSSGTPDLDSYYALILDGISGNFTAVVQIPYLTDTGSETRAGLNFQLQMADASKPKSQIQVSAIPNVGFRMVLNDKNNGDAVEIFTSEVAVVPPNVWLKVIRNGDDFTGFYRTDGATWTAIGTFNISTPVVDVGLFGKSGQEARQNTAHFDNFSLVDATTTYIQYEDSDGDSFGNPFAALATTSQTLLDGYVNDNTDCDDTDADIHPGATEECDGKDNDCDGTIDEGFETTIYYRDADGDGYGTSADTQPGCSPNAGYVVTPGDCNDNNPLINPGAPDILDNKIDEDCAGGPAVSTSDTNCDLISDTPLSVTIGGSTAIVMFILDDSGNMEWTVMCPENEGTFNGQNHYTDNNAQDRWKSQFHGYNRLYYNPNTTYEPWPKSTSYPSTTREFPDGVFTSASTHPLWGTPLNLTSDFVTIGKNNDPDQTTVTFGHYYVTSNNQPYLVDLGASDTGVTYYKVTQYDSDDHGAVEKLSRLSPPPSDVAIPQADLASARRNFANWFTYHRTRELATKAALGNALQGVSGLQIGLHTLDSAQANSIGKWSVPATLIDTETDVANFLDNVYRVTIDSNSTKPLRLALEDVGQYFDNEDNGATGGIGASPYADAANGGNCQQAFAILLTSGYGNGGAPSVGNADVEGGAVDSEWDGGEFAGSKSGTLPDVAMYYYENDLASGLADEVPLQDAVYEAPHQRMVTYSVSFGVTGHYDQANWPNCPPPPTDPTTPIDCPAWLSGGTNEAKVDELWHAAANGRGQYINTGTPQELADAINTVLNDITRRIGTAASVAVSSEKLETGLVIYQGFFDSGDWSGNLEAYDVDPSGTVNLTPKWSAKTKLNAANWNTGRHILTMNDATPAAVAFRYGNLSADQKAYVTENQVNYIRGDATNEEDNGGTFRDRNSKLGDITHSSPILHDGVVYVGANDGMFHAFDAETGNELFAYVPSFVYSNLEELTSTSYIHKFFADGTGTAKTVATASGNQDWVVSGLRKGGRGLFGINVTNPKTIKETSIPTIWEYPTQASPDLDMGYTYGEVTIAEGNDTTAGGQLVFAANGYDSPNGHAVLLILKLDGTLFKKIDTGVGSSTPGNCNGLSDPLVIDLDDDGKADVVYAGDIRGNLWKFDISKPSKASWDVAYKTGTDSKPLFTVQNSSGQIQPITSKPAAMFHCDPTQKGTILVFGTGRMLSDADLANTNVQTIYGIWDWQEEWDEHNGTPDAEAYHMGTFNTPSGTSAVRTLSNIDGNSTYFPQNVDLTLLQQAQTSATSDWRYTSNNAIDWFSPEEYLGLGSGASYTGGTHIGWYLNLPDTKERVITKTQIRDGKAYIVSIIPIPAPCSSGGTTVGTILNACNGGQLQDPQWDTNKDGIVDGNDSNPSGKKFDDDIYYAPAIIEDKLFFTKDRVEETEDETRGLFYWRIRE
jgi:type IV pilus assembly protein PilY1